MRFAAVAGLLHVGAPAGLLLGALGLTLVGPDQDALRRPNVVLLMADDLGWGDLGFQGNEVVRTPCLDAMATAGLVFERFYAAAPECSPTRASVLTGRHPYRFGVTSANIGHLLAQEVTLAELMGAAGYATGHFGKWHLGTLTRTQRDSTRGSPGSQHYAPPWEHGFDTCFSTEAKVPTWDPLLMPKREVRSARQRAVDRQVRSWEPVTSEEDAVPYGTAYWNERSEPVTENTRGDDSRVIMDRVIAFVREAVASERPFLAVVWFHAPHAPLVAGPAELAGPYGGHDDVARRYFACITGMDEQIGRLRCELRALDVAEDTMVWFTSDNGPAGKAGKAPGSAGGLSGRKRGLREGGIRVPGILEWPAVVAPGSRSSVPACTSDYLPTVLATLGLALPDDRPLDGVDLLPVVRRETTERPRSIAFRSGGQTALIDGRFKLFGNAAFDTDRWQLFDLVDDPAEARDLAEQDPERVSRMVAELRAWRESVDRSRQGRDYGG